MATTVKITMHRGPSVAVLGPMADQAAYRVAQKVRGRTLANIHRLGRIDTAAMINGVQVRRMPGRGALHGAYQVYSTAPHTIYQEYGTRAHGPRVASVMVFVPKGSGKVVFAKWVRGVKAGHFFRDAYRDTKATDALP